MTISASVERPSEAPFEAISWEDLAIAELDNEDVTANDELFVVDEASVVDEVSEFRSAAAGRRRRGSSKKVRLVVDKIQPEREKEEISPYKLRSLAHAASPDVREV